MNKRSNSSPGVNRSHSTPKIKRKSDPTMRIWNCKCKQINTIGNGKCIKCGSPEKRVNGDWAHRLPRDHPDYRPRNSRSKSNEQDHPDYRPRNSRSKSNEQIMEIAGSMEEEGVAKVEFALGNSFEGESDEDQNQMQLSPPAQLSTIERGPDNPCPAPHMLNANGHFECDICHSTRPTDPGYAEYQSSPDPAPTATLSTIERGPDNPCPAPHVRNANGDFECDVCHSTRPTDPGYAEYQSSSPDPAPTATGNMVERGPSNPCPAPHIRNQNGDFVCDVCDSTRPNDPGYA